MTIEGADFLIVGAGIAGAAAAFELSRLGKVLLLEREAHAGYHSTGRSVALYEPLYGGSVVERLARASLEFFESPPADFATHPLVQPRGALYFCEEGEEQDLADLKHRAQSVGHALRSMSAEEAVSTVPILRPDVVTAALFDSETRDIDAHRLHQGYLRAVRTRSGRILTGAEVMRAERCQSRWSVQTTIGTFEAPIVVNAAGAWADELAARAGVKPLRQTALRRTAVVLDPPAGMSVVGWPHVESIRDGFYFKPESGRLLMSPADETPVAPCDVQPDDLDIALAVDRFERLTALDVRKVGHTWAGLRSFLPDRSPAVGFDASAQGFFWLCGLGGFGIMTAPALGRCCFAAITSGTCATDVLVPGVARTALAPVRFTL